MNIASGFNPRNEEMNIASGFNPRIWVIIRGYLSALIIDSPSIFASGT